MPRGANQPLCTINLSDAVTLTLGGAYDLQGHVLCCIYWAVGLQQRRRLFALKAVVVT